VALDFLLEKTNELTSPSHQLDRKAGQFRTYAETVFVDVDSLWRSGQKENLADAACFRFRECVCRLGERHLAIDRNPELSVGDVFSKRMQVTGDPYIWFIPPLCSKLPLWQIGHHIWQLHEE